jgi:ribosomal protein S27AE
MAIEKRKMICPRCGAEMNHHADKLVYPATPARRQANDPGFGGVIEETHYCPGCGGVESRRVQ